MNCTHLAQGTIGRLKPGLHTSEARIVGTPRYLWRQLTPEQREELLAWRKNNQQPWHSPPHRPNYGHLHFLVSASCYEHIHHIGLAPSRMESFSTDLLCGAEAACHPDSSLVGLA